MSIRYPCRPRLREPITSWGEDFSSLCSTKFRSLWKEHSRNYKVTCGLSALEVSGCRSDAATSGRASSSLPFCRDASIFGWQRTFRSRFGGAHASTHRAARHPFYRDFELLLRRKGRVPQCVSRGSRRVHDLTTFLRFGLRGIEKQTQRLLSEFRLNVRKALYRNLMFDLFKRLRTPRKRVVAERQ